jgi:NTE family protein
MRRTIRTYCWTATIITLLVLSASAPTPAAEEPERPKIGLALSGGGAKGGAHVGVLKVLEELNVPVDYIAGTSIGSIVGGMYATGMSADELQEVIAGIDWEDALQDSPPRRDLSFRRKEDDRRYLMGLELGLRGKKIHWPRGFRTGQKLYFYLQALTLDSADIRDFQRLPIPFKCVATDISTGDPVVLENGNLATAMRASMAIPTVFSPVDLGGRVLVDGGITNNLPVDVVRAMGADVVIAVDLGAPLTTRQLNSALKIYGQMSRMLIRKNVETQLANADLIIDPGVGGEYGTMEFDKINELFSEGYDAAREMADELRKYSIDPQAYQRFREKQLRAPEVPPVVDSIKFRGNERVSDRVVAARIRLDPGEPLNFDELFDDISRIYGLGDFERVSFQLDQVGDENVLAIEMVEKSWGPNYLRFAINFNSSFDGNLNASILLNLLATRINSRGAEWRNDLQVGRQRQLLSEFYQPLDFKGRYFVAPRVDFERDRQSIYEDGTLVADFDVRQNTLGLDLGYAAGTFGELRVGLERGQGKSTHAGGVEIPEAEIDRIEIGNARVLLRADTLDDPYFPRRGEVLIVDAKFSREGLGADDEYDRYEGLFTKYGSFGRNSVFGGLEGGTRGGNELPLYAEFSIGGIGTLSGFRQNELRGQYYGVGRLGYYRQFGKKHYLGGWAELGNVWQTRDEIEFDSLIPTGTVFVGTNTMIGPLYLAYGYAEGGNSAAYFSLGQVFGGRRDF